MNSDERNELQFLRMRVDGMQHLLVAWAAALGEAGLVPVARTVDVLRAAQATALAEEGEDAARSMQYFIDRLAALADPGLPVAAAYRLLAALTQDVPPQHREALATWLSIATPRELVEDLLAASRRPRTAAPAGERAGGTRAKRSPRGAKKGGNP